MNASMELHQTADHSHREDQEHLFTMTVFRDSKDHVTPGDELIMTFSNLHLLVAIIAVYVLVVRLLPRGRPG